MKQLVSILAIFLLAIVLADDACAETDSPRFKSPSTGMMFSLVPGLFLHGAGSFYAESWQWGLGLLTAEVGGIILIASGLDYEETLPSPPPPGTYSSWDFGEDDNEGLIIAGAALVVGSWLADIVITQVLIKKHNEEVRRRFDNLSLNLSPSRFDGRTITLQFAYRF